MSVLWVLEGCARDLSPKEETVKRRGVRITYLVQAAVGAFEAFPLEEEKKKKENKSKYWPLTSSHAPVCVTRISPFSLQMVFESNFTFAQ